MRGELVGEKEKQYFDLVRVAKIPYNCARGGLGRLLGRRLDDFLVYAVTSSQSHDTYVCRRLH